MKSSSGLWQVPQLRLPAPDSIVSKNKHFAELDLADAGLIVSGVGRRARKRFRGGESRPRQD